MSRKPRFKLIGIPQHVIQRGNNRQPCFYAEDDYYRYLHDLKEAAHKNQCAIHAYVLMTNHVHLLVTPFHVYGVSHMMQDLGRKYVHYINHVYRRTGTLWEGRFKSSLVDSEKYLFTCMRYIELNPVRASMVTHPGDYQWSSYGSNGMGHANTLLSMHVLYEKLGGSELERQFAYRELFRNHLDKDELHSIRSALNEELVLGRDDFKEKIKQMTKRQVNPAPLGRPKIEEEAGHYLVL
ncbi:MAG: transposase [Gammaproteobacteria bacterium]